MATVHCVADRCELRIGRADGSLVKLVQLRERYRGGNLWSRDQRWIAYVGSPPSGEYHVNVIDVATGRLTTLTAVRSVVPSLLWDEESNSVLVTIALGTGAARHEVFERVGLDGQVRLIRDFVVGASLSGGSAITSTTGLLMSTAGVRRVTLEGDSANVVVLPKGAGASTSYSVLALSARRIALRRSSDDNYHTVIEVVNTDGSSPVTIDVPFAVFAGPNQRRFLPGDSAIVLWGGPTASEPDAGVYLVSIDTKSVKKLFTVPLKSLTRELSVSPDGRTILYVTSETASPRVFIMDLSSLRLSWQ
jgi:hypothetical protein